MAHHGRWILLPVLASAAAPLPSSAQPTPWRMVEELRIGVEQGARAYEFSPRPIVTARADGTIFVVDRGAKQVRVFDARGRHLRSFGREGAGPGEFLGIGEAGWVGDTLWVTDPMQLRTTLFTADGRVVRTIGTVIRATPELAPAGAWALLADGSVLARPGGRERREDGTPLSMRRPLVRVDPGSGDVDTIAWRELQRRMIRVVHGDRTISMPQRWDDSPLFAVAPNGTMLVRVERAYAGGEPRFRVTRFSPGGRMLHSREYRYPPVAIPRDAGREWAMSRAREIAEVRPVGSVRAFADAIARELYVPPHHPPVTAVVVGADGTVWLRREDRGESTHRWLVLGPRGEIEASLRMPATLVVHHADRSHVYGVMEGELDVPYVLRYRAEPVRR